MISFSWWYLFLDQNSLISVLYSVLNYTLFCLVYLYTVQPWYNKVPRNWQNLFPIKGAFFVISRYFSIYFTITGVNKIVCYTEDFIYIYYRGSLYRGSTVTIVHNLLLYGITPSWFLKASWLKWFATTRFHFWSNLFSLAEDPAQDQGLDLTED